MPIVHMPLSDFVQHLLSSTQLPSNPQVCRQLLTQQSSHCSEGLAGVSLLTLLITIIVTTMMDIVGTTTSGSIELEDAAPLVLLRQYAGAACTLQLYNTHQVHKVVWVVV